MQRSLLGRQASCYIYGYTEYIPTRHERVPKNNPIGWRWRSFEVLPILIQRQNPLPPEEGLPDLHPRPCHVGSGVKRHLLNNEIANNLLKF